MPKELVNERRSSAELLDSISRSLNLLVKLKVADIQGDRPLSEVILLLHSLGCRPVDIADYLGKTSNDVNPVISRARKGRSASNATKGKRR